MRKPIKEGDIKPMIVDIHDKLSIFNTWGTLRRKYYKKNKYEVNLFEALDDKCISPLVYLNYNNIVDKTAEIDVIKEYVSYKYGDLHYELEEEAGVDMNKYTYNNDLNEIFKLKYGEESEDESD
jgi:hypothetical protein